MTCEDCIKNEVCELYIHLYNEQDVEKRCKHIKGRCKDCKHRRESLHRSYCLPVFGLKRITDLNAYCSYWETE